jgi:hypothetical protein
MFIRKSRDALRSLIGGSVFFIAMTVAATPAHAAFHLWNLNEIYSNSNGTLQFIELQTTFGSQQFVGGQQISVTNGGTPNTFTIPANLPGDTTNHFFLIGTAGIQAAGGPVPDYIMPNNFLFTGGGTISFFGANSGPYPSMPTDGSKSLTWNGSNWVLASPNSPTNFTGQAGTVVVPEPTAFALIAACGICSILRRRARQDGPRLSVDD